MHGERDQLAKFVFPEIRDRCTKHGIDFCAVDLRWGITEAQARRQETLRLCFVEIERCQPYFIGLLATDYGQLGIR
jgi:hypothetical protein